MTRSCASCVNKHSKLQIQDKKKHPTAKVVIGLGVSIAIVLLELLSF